MCSAFTGGTVPPSPHQVELDTGIPGSDTYSDELWNGGQAFAAFGVTHIGARVYDPTSGRFLQRDPLLIPAGASRTNPYSFAFNDPVNLSDPSGLTPVWTISKSITVDFSMETLMATAATGIASKLQNPTDNPVINKAVHSKYIKTGADGSLQVRFNLMREPGIFTKAGRAAAGAFDYVIVDGGGYWIDFAARQVGGTVNKIGEGYDAASTALCGDPICVDITLASLGVPPPGEALHGATLLATKVSRWARPARQAATLATAGKGATAAKGAKVALGLAQHPGHGSVGLLKNFSKHVGAKNYWDFFDDSEQVYSRVTNMMENASELHFNLDGVLSGGAGFPKTLREVSEFGADGAGVTNFEFYQSVDGIPLGWE